MKDMHGILAGLGGLENIQEMEPCITRLRVEVTDPSRVDAAAVRSAGAHGLLVRGRVVQVVVGPELDALLSEVTDAVGPANDDA